MAQQKKITPSTASLKKLGRQLIDSRREIRPSFGWPWLEDYINRPITKKAANKYIFGAIIDYQMDADWVWAKAKEYTEVTLGDPPDLFDVIARQSEKQWMKKRDTLKLHRFPSAHKRVWRISRFIVDHYDGDARKIWKNAGQKEVLARLNEMKMGPQISNMIVGSLIDTKQISRKGESSQSSVKADLNVNRVLGRAVYGGKPVSPFEAKELTKKMYPRQPWLLDMPLFAIGKQYCKANNPNCKECPMTKVCTYSKEQ